MNQAERGEDISQSALYYVFRLEKGFIVVAKEKGLFNNPILYHSDSNYEQVESGHGCKEPEKTSSSILEVPLSGNPICMVHNTLNNIKQSVIRAKRTKGIFDAIDRSSQSIPTLSEEEAKILAVEYAAKWNSVMPQEYHDISATPFYYVFPFYKRGFVMIPKLKFDEPIFHVSKLKNYDYRYLTDEDKQILDVQFPLKIQSAVKRHSESQKR